MTDRKVHVYVELDGNLYHVGQLWARSNREKEGASFSIFLPLKSNLWLLPLNIKI